MTALDARPRVIRRERLFPGDRAASYLLLVATALLTVLPLLYMLSLALQSDAETFAGDPVLIPAVPQWENFTRLFAAAPFGRFFLNSLIMAGAITISHLVFDPLVGYVFAKFEFPGKRIAFVAILATLMVPFFVRMLPIYAIFSQLGWIDTYQGLIVPFLIDAYGIFLMRQFIAPLPNELMEAARVDGASELRIYAQIILPQLKPALAVLGLFSFVFQWNEFLWPLIATSSTEMRTMPIGLTLFNQEYFTQWNLTAAGALILFLPTAVLFVLTQRFLVRGIALSGLK
ncbi:carbohydrate ABC transporter permease [Auraticoccus monumenti]|uniref:Carbohydrate ABC transporter membrane protein 2, CUT1 family n=1 Tax=Auraticoccus monumenti TaxID=675864 RepID=A0A1G6T8L7_9ACTN|nr:carbohydrate ABC transporter permease [Auraticoccus monumenti]SDD24705.1 carbohydrate ABC transporter membrane protein 2, CUT1 family [Auraticoccus monumenti]